jgi:hypothetical protein
MGYKRVCLTCRKAFSTGRDYHLPERCPECGSEYIFYNHKFRPPKRDDIKAWKVIDFLYENGFTFQSIFNKYEYVAYPENLEDAEKFVVQYKSQANNKQ